MRSFTSSFFVRANLEGSTENNRFDPLVDKSSALLQHPKQQLMEIAYRFWRILFNTVENIELY